MKTLMSWRMAQNIKLIDYTEKIESFFCFCDSSLSISINVADFICRFAAGNWNVSRLFNSNVSASIILRRIKRDVDKFDAIFGYIETRRMKYSTALNSQTSCKGTVLWGMITSAKQSGKVFTLFIEKMEKLPQICDSYAIYRANKTSRLCP